MEKTKPAATRGITSQAYRSTAAALAALALGLLLVIVEFRLPHEGFVQELTVSSGIISDGDKLRDLRLAPLAIGTQLALLIGLILAGFNLSRISNFLFWLLAGGLPLYLLNVLPNNMPLLLFGSLGVSAGAAFYLSRSEWQNISGQFIVAATGAALSAYHLFGADPAWAFALSLPLAISATLIVGPAAALWAGSVGSVLVALVVSLSAPFFWFDGPDPGISLIDGVHALLALAVLVETAVVLRHSIRYGDAGLTTRGVGVAVALLVLTGPVVSPAVIPIDDYHFGEKLLAAQALFTDGGWFVSFFSPHGLSDAAGAVVAWLQGDLTGAGIAVGEQLFRWYAAVLLIWLLVNRLGPVPATGLTLVFPIWDATSLLLALNLVLATEVMALRRAVLAGALGAGVAAAGVFFNAGPGAACTVVAGVAGVVLHWRRGHSDLFQFAASGAVTGLILIVLFWAEVAGQLHFLRVSAASNLTIYGNGDFSVIGQYQRHFLYVLAPLLAVALTRGKWSFNQTRSSTERVLSLIALVAPVVVVALILNQYAAARLDDRGWRGIIVSSGLLVFLPVWLSLLQGREQIPLSVSAVCMLLLLAVTQGATNLPSSLLPPAPLGPRVQIAEDIPELGTGGADPVHVAMLREVRDVVDAILDPGETFINFTNRNAFYFYFNRPNPVPIASTYNAAPEAFQQDFIAALGDTPPALALVHVDNFDHDGLSLPLRSHLLYEFLIENYQPFVRGDYVYAVRNDLESRIERLAPEEPRNLGGKRTYRIGDYSDGNWQHGIASGANAQQWSFALPPSLSGLIRTGDRLIFSDGQERRVTVAEGTNVRTDPTLTARLGNESKPPAFSIMNRELLANNLWARALYRPQLGRIPSAWGRSIDKLGDALHAVSMRPEMINIDDAAADPGQQARFNMTGPDPRWIFALPEPISPDNAGVLALSVECVGTDVHPVIQVFWKSPTGEFSEEASLTFEASFGKNLIPLDSSPYWSVLPNIAQIRVDVANPEACSLVKMEHIALYDRM